MYMYMCVCACVCRLEHMCGGQRTISRVSPHLSPWWQSLLFSQCTHRASCLGASGFHSSITVGGPRLQTHYGAGFYMDLETHACMACVLLTISPAPLRSLTGTRKHPVTQFQPFCLTPATSGSLPSLLTPGPCRNRGESWALQMTREVDSA